MNNKKLITMIFSIMFLHSPKVANEEREIQVQGTVTACEAVCYTRNAIKTHLILEYPFLSTNSKNSLSINTLYDLSDAEIPQLFKTDPVSKLPFGSLNTDEMRNLLSTSLQDLFKLNGLTDDEIQQLLEIDWDVTFKELAELAREYTKRTKVSEEDTPNIITNVLLEVINELKMRLIIEPEDTAMGQKIMKYLNSYIMKTDNYTAKIQQATSLVMQTVPNKTQV